MPNLRSRAQGDSPTVSAYLPRGTGPNILDQAVNYWRMEEAGTDDRVDSIGTDDLTPGNAITTIAGKNNLAANFDANNESLIDTGWRAIGFPGFSISAWIKRSGYVTETTAVIVSENAATFQAFTLQAYNAGGYLTCSFRDSTIYLGLGPRRRGLGHRKCRQALCGWCSLGNVARHPERGNVEG